MQHAAKKQRIVTSSDNRIEFAGVETTTSDSTFDSTAFDVTPNSPLYNSSITADYNGSLLPPSSNELIGSSGIVLSPENRLLSQINNNSTGLTESQKLAVKAHSSIQDLESLIELIFEADDDREIDTSGKAARNTTVWVVDSPGEASVLANDIFVRLEGMIRRAIQAGAYSQIALDDILRLQRIMLRSVRKSSKSCFISRQSFDDEPDEVVFQQLALLDNGLKAAKTIIRTMHGSREEKQICSEDVAKEVIDYVCLVMENVIIPLFAPVSTGERVLAYEKLIVGVMQEVVRTINLLSILLSEQELSEITITRLEFACIALVFGENASKEKDSFFGLTNVENIRVAAMDIFTQVFASYPAQRTFLLTEILTSLEKLPVGRLSARQYKLIGGGSIQLVTALILRLIQTAGSVDRNQLKLSLESISSKVLTTETGDFSKEKEKLVTEEFIAACQKCNSSAVMCSNVVVNFIVDRAIKSQKARDEQPYRELLDLFAQDFLAVLELPGWPAAETLVRTLAMRMMTLANNEKDSAQINGMALEILGFIGVKLITMRNQLSGVEADEIGLVQCNEYANTLLLYLDQNGTTDSSALSAYNYFLCEWVCILNGFESERDIPIVQKSMAKMIQMVQDPSWASKEKFSVETLTSIKYIYLQFSYMLPLFKLYERLFSEILKALRAEKISSRTKALKTLGLLVAKDPEILTSANVFSNVSARLKDESPLVRDAAVDTIGRFILTQPDVTQRYYMLLCERANDTGIGVRKRVIRLLREIYIATKEIDIQVEIVDRLLHRLEDSEEGIGSLARRALEEFFFSPIDVLRNSDDLAYKQTISNRVNIMLQVRERGNQDSKLVKLLQNFLDQMFPFIESGYVDSNNYRLGSMIVTKLHESVIDWSESVQASVQTLFGLLANFALASRFLFTAEQLVSLQSYLASESLKDDSTTYFALVIFRNILPKFGALRTRFSTEVQQILLKRLTKFNLRELSEAVPCLWDISVMLQDTRRLAMTAISCLKMVTPFKVEVLSGRFTSYEKEQMKVENKVIRLLHLLGNIGRYCNLEEHFKLFTSQVPSAKGKSVVEIIILTLQIFSMSKCVPSKISRIAIRNIGNVAITHPQIYMTKLALNVLDNAWRSEDCDCKDAVVKMLGEFLSHNQIREDAAAKGRGSRDEEVDLGILKGDTNKFANDGVSASLCQRYLNNILEIATRTEDEYALSGIVLLEQIVNQGYANPRACVPTLIALETSSNCTIRRLAIDIHQLLHEKHESLIESSYVDGIRQAFEYHERTQTVNDLNYADFAVMYGLMKNNRNAKRKFLRGIVKTLDFDSSKYLADDDEINMERTRMNHLNYVLYTCRRLVMLEFATIDEPHTAVYGLDQILGGTGMPLAIAISEHSPAESFSVWTRNLAISCLIMRYIWVTRLYICQVYNLSEQVCREFASTPRSGNSKEFSRPITRSAVINAATTNESLLKNWMRFDNEEITTDEKIAAVISGVGSVLNASISGRENEL
ncbi:sister chromatid cohesion C-terminus-domain-containing protein [Lipomyces oligophaga]|uniref:sister chromatid cohesion C-terminus-domain-containing protein n=1 Tax=Lipomyces oligophaga TaxID=45792 RepID=UPI0034CE2E88